MTERDRTPPHERDVKLEIALGTLLRAGVLLAAVIVAVGGLFLLLARAAWTPDFRAFRGGEVSLRSLPGILREARALDPGGIVQTGLLVLIATPVMRVLFSLVGFARQRDWLYVLLTLIVLCALAVGLVGLGG
jgi:uncharacterized membrane protein